MTHGSASLVLDLGNSETRGIVLFNRDLSTGKMREHQFSISNRFSDVADDYVPSSDYSEDTSTIMKINAVVNGTPFVGTFANGEVQAREMNVAPLRPSAGEKKFMASTTALSFELAMLHAYKALQRMTRASSLQSLDITWDIVVLLPPGDVDIGHDQMIELIKSVKEVNCTFPNVQIPLKLNKVTVMPEAFCAYVGAVYDRGHVVRPEMTHLLGETTLIFDIGAGTTDILIVKDNKIIDSSKHTVERGGNNITQMVRKSLRLEGIVLGEAELTQGVVSGKIKDGAKEKDITDYINKAKDEIANYLVADMRDYLEETEFPVRSIGYVLVCGGGAIGGDPETEEGKKIKAVGTVITDYLKRLSPNIELVKLPEHEVNEPDAEGVNHKVTKPMSPRDLNILGARIFAELL